MFKFSYKLTPTENLCYVSLSNLYCITSNINSLISIICRDTESHIKPHLHYVLGVFNDTQYKSLDILGPGISSESEATCHTVTMNIMTLNCKHTTMYTLSNI